MARARNIKPGFFKNEDLAECSALARLLFAGLWCEADREGRLEDRPRRLKAEYLAYDECDIEELLGQLESRGFIRRYSAGGERFIAIPKFGRHQNPHVREPASSIPEPSEHSASTVQAQCNNGESMEPARLIPDSPSLIPDSPSPIPAPGVPPSAGAVAPLVKIPVEIPAAINPTAWADWEHHRRKRRKPISDRAAREQWAALSSLTHDQQAACIAASIRNDYQGLFPEKFTGQPRAGPQSGTRARSIADDLNDRSWAG